ncbi:hypothetical protein AUJ14_02380 [Candidatus Micrarchaeota archaeon CG1_02_55_22]|nr:MAG: hypothetical protein AUJ14_02380 [Candidatus Micrarchaeota archaeon CG1_02_55_22]
MYITNVTRKGQTTIPAELRAAFGIQSEDRVEWTVEEGRLVLKPRKRVKDPLAELAKLRFKASKTAVELCKTAEDDFW